MPVTVTTTVARRGGRGTTLLSGAAAVALVHAGFSAYWAFGGRWLLPTVGAWAVDLVRRERLLSAAVLGLVAVAKLAAGAVPLLVESGRLPARRVGRRIEGVGAAVLVAYGALNVVTSWAVLGGVIRSAGGYDRAAELGHAVLWDPLFLAWGILLAAGLRATRR